MKYTLILGLLAFCGLSAAAQTDTEQQRLVSMRSYLAESDYVYPHVDTPPMFPGGQARWSRYVSAAPEVINAGMEAYRQGLRAGLYLVNVRFMVNPDGSIGEVKTLGNPVGYGLENAAMDLVRNSGRWTPANIEGADTRSWVSLQIRFHVFE